MKCPYCGAQDTKVIDSRPADDNSAIRRRRQCEQCGKRFTTYEKLETLPLMIIKKDNSREAYDRSKIEKGILLSCHKRPISSEQIRNMIDEIETEIFSREEKEIPASDVGELVMRKLKDVDEVAYVRFASVYREFKDVNAFMELGYRRNVVILTRHKGYKKKPEKAGLEKLFYRRYPEFAKALRNRPWVYNRQLEEIEALKEEGKIFLIRPSEPLSISRTSKDPAEIEAVYQIGMEDGKRQLPALLEWLRG